jgi:acyl carrier protein
MNKIELMNELENLLELPLNSMSEDTVLNTILLWDSMAKLSLIVLLADNFNLRLTSQKVNSFIIVNDILKVCNL